MTKFVVKDENGRYYGSHSFHSYIKDALNSDIEFFDDENHAKDCIKEHSSFFKDKECEVLKVNVCKNFYEAPRDTEISQAKFNTQNLLLKVRDHYDAVTTLLNDPSLNHDINAISGRICRELVLAGMNFTNAEVYEYSDAIGKRAYRDKDDNWLPNKMLNSDNLAFKARRAAAFFATMTDTLALLDKYEDWAVGVKQKKEE